MTYRLIILGPARSDLREARRWYARISPQLAQDFTMAAEETFSRLCYHPLAHQLLKGIVRQALIEHFPYSVVYTLRDNAVRVIAVFHQKRSPSVWQKRVPIYG